VISAVVLSLSILVAVFLAWGARPLARVLLVVVALLFAAVLYLPGGTLSSAVGPQVMSGLAAVARWFAVPLALLGHLVGFALLAVVLWWLRPDWRGWRCVAVLLVLAVGSELAQLLTVTRGARVEDAVANLCGVVVGLLVVGLVSGLRWVMGARGRG
jgi:hypothetical protein